MRLGQLARQLEVSSQDIITYLSKEGVTINEHPNSKFPEEYENQVILHFGGTVSQSEEELVATISPNPVPEIPEEPHVEPVVLQEETLQEPIEIKEQSPIEEIEVIKAPKIELPGLKVIGKIELPTPKPKSEEPDSADDEKPIQDRKGKFDKKKRLTPEEREAKRLKYKLEKQKREEWEAHKQKLREERKKKEIRTAYYEKVVKPNVAPKLPKKSKKKATHSEEIDRRPKPKTLLGRIWRWLNT